MKGKTDELFGDGGDIAEENIPEFSENPDGFDRLPERVPGLPSLEAEATMLRGGTMPPAPVALNDSDRMREIWKRMANDKNADPKDREAAQKILDSDYFPYVTGEKSDEPAPTPPVRASSRPPRSAYLADIIAAADAPPKRKSSPPAIPKAALMVKKENTMTEKKAVPPPLPDVSGTVAEGTAFEAIAPKNDPAKTTIDVEMAPVEESKAEKPATDKGKHISKRHHRAFPRHFKKSGIMFARMRGSVYPDKKPKTTESSASSRLAAAAGLFTTPDPHDGDMPLTFRKLKQSRLMFVKKPRTNRGSSYPPKDPVAKVIVDDPALKETAAANAADMDDLLSDTNGHGSTPSTTPPPLPPENDVMKRRSAITGLVIGLGVVVCLAILVVAMMSAVKKKSKDTGSANDKVAIPATVIVAKKAKQNDAGLAVAATAMNIMDFTTGEEDAPINFAFSYEADKDSPIYRFAKGLDIPTKVADCFPEGSKLRSEDVTWCCLGLMNTKKSRVSGQELLNVSRCMIWKEQAKFAWWKAENAKAKRSLASNSN
jgi:hypothetical protein